MMATAPGTDECPAVLVVSKPSRSSSAPTMVVWSAVQVMDSEPHEADTTCGYWNPGAAVAVQLESVIWFGPLGSHSVTSPLALMWARIPLHTPSSSGKT